MIARLAAQPKFCPQFHLSLQSGCDNTLKAMNRHYNCSEYAEIVTNLRNAFENSSMTTDVMVGFAGETEEDFNASLKFVKSIGFAKVHIFAYSRRRGTVAYGLKDQVIRAEKARRSHIMGQAAALSENAFLKSEIGNSCPVLFETGTDGYAEGYTPNYSRVKVKCNRDLCGKILNVKITAAENGCCIGEITGE